MRCRTIRLHLNRMTGVFGKGRLSETMHSLAPDLWGGMAWKPAAKRRSHLLKADNQEQAKLEN